MVTFIRFNLQFLLGLSLITLSRRSSLAVKVGHEEIKKEIFRSSSSFSYPQYYPVPGPGAQYLFRTPGLHQYARRSERLHIKIHALLKSASLPLFRVIIALCSRPRKQLVEVQIKV